MPRKPIYPVACTQSTATASDNHSHLVCSAITMVSKGTRHLKIDDDNNSDMVSQPVRDSVAGNLCSCVISTSRRHSLQIADLNLMSSLVK